VFILENMLYSLKIQALFRIKSLPGLLLLILFLVPQTKPARAQVKLLQRAEVPVFDAAGSAYSNAVAGGLNSAQFSSFDFDGDGVEDLLAFDRMANRPAVFLWREDQWRYSPDFEYLLPPSLVNWVRMVDMDCDGEKDLITSTLLGVRIYKTSRNEQGKPEFDLLTNALLTEGSSGMINLQIAATDVPFIGDVDGDGLPDVLTYNFASGGFVEFHKNVSLEGGGSCADLAFRRETRTWGDFEECDCNAFAFGGEDCTGATSGARVEHAGGKTLLLLDNNGDAIPDLLGGHELCDELYFFPNQGSGQEARFDSFISGFPGDRPVLDMPFPAPYLLDVDKDGLEDLVVSSNLAVNVVDQLDVQRSMRWFRNEGTAAQPDFKWQADDFLTGTMLDVGENAYPAGLDVNGDGRQDLVLGQRGLWRNGNFEARLTLLLQEEDASWSVEEENFAGLAGKGFSNVKPQFADLNGDGVEDLVFSASLDNRTRLYLMEGTLNNGQWMTGSSEPLELDFTMSLNDNAYLIDVDEDAAWDILLARSNGQLDYYRNQGNLTFRLEQERFLGIDRSTSATNLSLALADFSGDDRIDMISTDFSGTIRFYADIRSRNAEPVEEILEVNGSMQKGNTGIRSFAYAMEAADGTSLLWIGNVSGGLWLFDLEPVVTSLPAPSDLPKAELWPNPFRGGFFVRSPEDAQLELLDLQGKRLYSKGLLKAGEEEYLLLEQWPNGIYILRLRYADGRMESIRLWKR
jgi:hypothetical protein